MSGDNFGDTKYRYFAFFVYRCDAAGRVVIDRDDLVRRLAGTFGEFAVSPMHQPDEEANSEHFHVIYRHPGPILPSGARKLLLAMLSDVEVHAHNDYFLALHHPRVYMRYLIHLDNPEKEQFPEGRLAVDVLNGFPYEIARELTRSEMDEIQMEIESFAYEFNIFEYASMTMFLANRGMVDHYRYFTTHTHHFGKFLDSLRYSAERDSDADLDK